MHRTPTAQLFIRILCNGNEGLYASQLCYRMCDKCITFLKGNLTLSHTTQMGDAVYAYYDGTVTGVKEGNAFSELPHGQSV